MHTGPHSSGMHYKDPIFDGQPLPSCDKLLIIHLEEFEHNQTLSYNDKMIADNANWEKFNDTSAHIFGVDARLVPLPYKDYIGQIHGEREWTKLEARCGRRAKAELR